MYPFRDENIYIRNAWYVACLTEELGRGPVARTIMDKPVVIYRSEEGVALAMHGLCPHRSYPLALNGKVVGDSLQCAYHGFAFEGRTGRCTAIPSSGVIPSAFRQRVYPLVERGPFIWIWPGDPDLAGDAPSLDSIKMGEGYVTSPMMEPVLVKARYMLGVENLMDLTHIGFLHAATAGHSAIVKAKLDVKEAEDVFQVTGKNILSEWTPYHDAVFTPARKFQGVAEHHSETIVVTPGYIPVHAQKVVSIEGVPADEDIFGELWFHHILTPETACTTHYFGTQTRKIRQDESAFGDMLRDADTHVRSEDIEAMEAIERQFQTFGDPPIELMVPSDVGAGRLRRRFQRLIDQENNVFDEQVSARPALAEPASRGAA